MWFEVVADVEDEDDDDGDGDGDFYIKQTNNLDFYWIGKRL